MLRKFRHVLYSAAIFLIVTMPFRELFRVMAITEMRPASALPPVFGLMLGIPGALGCAIGNLAADIISGYSPIICVLGFAAQFTYGVIPLFIWKYIRKNETVFTLGNVKNVIRYIAVILVNSLIMAGILGGIMQAVGISSLFSMATLMIFFNNFIFCMVLGIPLVVIMARFITKAKGISLNERFVLAFLLLGVLTAGLIGVFAYTELHHTIADPLMMWNRIYMYIAADLFLFYLFAVAFMWYAEGSLTRVIAEKERLGAELDIATKIQASMLPCIFPAFPHRKEFDIYASMRPAKEVGGDFYDFFFINDNTLAVVMADVSGKGVPAALFMVIAKTLIKNNAQDGKSPGAVFEAVNNLLCENNEAGMFVTAFLGYLDIPTGRFTYVNAGHNPPLLRANERFDWLKAKPGFVLAGMEDIFYKQHEVTLAPGDALFLYTDGVTEAVNNENNLFSNPRLLETVNAYLDAPLRELCVSVKREIDRFAEGAEQADDITMLALWYKGEAETK